MYRISFRNGFYSCSDYHKSIDYAIMTLKDLYDGGHEWYNCFSLITDLESGHQTLVYLDRRGCHCVHSIG